MNTPIFTRRILILASAISLGGALSADAGQIMADTTSRTRIAAEVDANPTMTMTADTVRRAASTASATAKCIDPYGPICFACGGIACGHASFMYCGACK